MPSLFVSITISSHLNKRNEIQTSYNLRNNHADITMPNPKTEYLKRILGHKVME